MRDPCLSLSTREYILALFFTDVSNGSVSFPVSFPLRLRALVERDRARFQEQISENKIEKRENLNKKETLHARMRNFSIQVWLHNNFLLFFNVEICVIVLPGERKNNKPLLVHGGHFSFLLRDIFVSVLHWRLGLVY